MASGSYGHVGRSCTTTHLLDFTCSGQASAEHFQQCAEFLLLRNRGLGPLAVTVLSIALAMRAAATVCAAVQSTDRQGFPPAPRQALRVQHPPRLPQPAFPFPAARRLTTATVSAARPAEPDDVLVVTRLDRLARSTRDLLNVIDAVTKRRAGFRSLKDTWADTTSPHGRLMLTVLGGLAEFERELIRARTGEGRKRAKERGVRFGRPRKLTPHQRHAHRYGEPLSGKRCSTGYRPGDPKRRYQESGLERACRAKS
jgi:Resolvase, N terminal domain